MSEDKYRSEIARFCHLIYEKSYVASTDGNVSVRLPKNMTGRHEMVVVGVQPGGRKLTLSVPITIRSEADCQVGPEGAATSASLEASPNPAVVGQLVTLTATVDPVAPATGHPLGTVEFFDGATSLGTAQLHSPAVLTTSSLSPGQHEVTAAYAGERLDDGPTVPGS